MKLSFPNNFSVSLCLAAVFFLYALPQVLFLGTMTPPFQVPDEVNHFCRAFQISEGGFMGGQPAQVDPEIRQLVELYGDIPFNSQETTSKRREWLSGNIFWSSNRILAEFPNTAAYSPLHYIPQSVGVGLGRMLQLSVRDSLVLARICTGLFAVVLCTVAIYICRRGKYILFTLLLFPMTLYLFASVNQDGVLIPVAAFAVGVLSNILSSGRHATIKELVLLAAAVLFVVLGRPPYAPFVLLFLLPGLLGLRRPKIAGALIILSIVTLVSLWLASKALGQALSYDPSKNPKMQLQFLLHAMGSDMFFIPKLLWHTLQENTLKYFEEAVGVLGWLDTRMPALYYRGAGCVSVCAVLAELLGKARTKEASVNKKRMLHQKIMIMGIVFLTLSMLLFAEYLMATDVGLNVIAGLQGRYLIPVGLLLATALPQFDCCKMVRMVCIACVLLFPLFVTSISLPMTIVGRYYAA